MRIIRERRRVVLISLIVFFLYVALYLTYEDFLDIDNLKNFIDSQGIWAPLVFILIYIGVSLTGISPLPLIILAGVLFGLWRGLLYVLIATTSSSIIAFYIARCFSIKLLRNVKEKERRMFMRILYRIEDNAEKRGFITIFILRMSFFPYTILSYASGLIKKLSFRDYILATIFANIVTNFFIILFGYSLTQNLKFVIASIISIIFFFVIVYLVTRKMKNHI